MTIMTPATMNPASSRDIGDRLYPGGGFLRHGLLAGLGAFGTGADAVLAIALGDEEAAADRAAASAGDERDAGRVGGRLWNQNHKDERERAREDAEHFGFPQCRGRFRKRICGL